MNVAFVLLIFGFSNCLFIIQHVESVPRNEVSVYLKSDDDDASDLRGKVYLSFNGRRSQLLEASYTDWSTSSVICRQLGAGPPVLTLSTNHNADGYSYYYSTSHIQCTGWESELSDCEVDFSHSSLLFSPKVMEVKCAPPFAKDFDILFVQPFEDSHQGIVLTYLDGRWGPISGNTSNSNAIVCNEVGCKPGEDLHGGSNAVQVFADPVIRNLTCRGDESKIQECSFNIPDNQTFNSLANEPVYITACTDPSLKRVKPMPYTLGGNDYPSYPQDIRSSSFVSVLAIIVLMAVSLVICLRCGLGGDHSDVDSVQVDLGSPSDVQHVYQRYHTGSGPGYQQVPCTVYQAPPAERNLPRPSHSRKDSAQRPRDPPSNEGSTYSTGPGRGYATVGLYDRNTAPGRHHQSFERDYQTESIGGYQPGSGPEYNVQPVRRTITHQMSPTSFQPRSGPSYPSVPQSIPEGTMTGSTCPMYEWPTIAGIRSPSSVHYGAPYFPVSPERDDPGNDQSDPELPSYSEAVLRSSFLQS